MLIYFVKTHYSLYHSDSIMVVVVVLHARVLVKFPVYLSYKLKRVNLVEEFRECKTEEDSQDYKICTTFKVNFYLFIPNFARRFPFSVIIVIVKI